MMLRSQMLRSSTLRALIAGLVIIAAVAVTISLSPREASARAAAKVQTITVKTPANYVPKPPDGAKDLYHCSVVNPHLKQDMVVTTTAFHPGTKEVHHAIVYRVDPEHAAAAQELNNNGKGWTCFGEPSLSNDALGEFSGMPWLCGWSPGHGADVMPTGLGAPLQKGSVLIVQIHYNTLIGAKPDSSYVTMKAVPAAGSNIQTVSIQQLPAALDIPCPEGVTGPLCDRAASIADLSKRFGSAAAITVYGLERFCGRDPMNPPVGNSTSCTWPVRGNEVIQRITPHMHLLGQSMTVTVNPGTPQAQVILNVPNYNFDNQVAHNITPTVHVGPGDKIEVSCTWNPSLRALNPQTKKLPPRFITWGDGSSDEMCLAVMTTTPA